ncbi:MAG: OmpH family outer membrane protein [Treponema sp.]|nr:OmpH family outer membrane protein [Treponema sp.]
MKKCFFVFLFSVVAMVASFAQAQQITRFGVVDTAKVYQAYFKNSSPMRNYEAKKAEFQGEINKRADEIRTLRTQKNEALSLGNDYEASNLDAEIAKKTESLTEYTKSKNLELENLKANMQNSNEFYTKLYKVIERVAENEGFTMILSLQQNNGILWYSTSVDVTEKVISELGLK